MNCPLAKARGFKRIGFKARVGITTANLSILKNGKAKAIRLSTLEAICKLSLMMTIFLVPASSFGLHGLDDDHFES